MVQGRHDQVAPASSAERYAELLEAPSKQLVWFEHSAHMPYLEGPSGSGGCSHRSGSTCQPMHDDPSAAPCAPDPLAVYRAEPASSPSPYSAGDIMAIE